MEQDELERISELLLGLSREELLALHQRITDKAQFVDYLGESLGAAVAKASDTDSFQQSIAPVVASGVLKTARQEPMEMGKAIAPALGPAIRGMVALALENMSQRVDAHIKTNFSIQGFKWRLEEKRTGVPLTDIVLRETLDFRVEHVMLIHQESGTLLQEVSQPDIKTKDPAVVSSMLSAVSDFVVDAFGATDSSDEPQTYKVGNLTAYVEKIGDLALAAVVRGTVSSKLKQLLRERLETICLVFGEKAHHFDGDIDDFEASESMLKDCLISVAKQNEDGTPANNKSPVLIFAIVGLCFVALLSVLIFQGWQSQIEKTTLANFESALASHPGSALLGVERGEPIIVRMLVDPLADAPNYLAQEYGYTESQVSWNLSPYESLDASLFDQRLLQYLEIPESIEYHFESGRLSFSGRAATEWFERARLVPSFLAEVDLVDLTQVTDLNSEAIATLVTEIVDIRVDFEYAEVALTADGENALQNLKTKVAELDELAIRTGQHFDLVVHIDPLDLSVDKERDLVRSLRRVNTLENYLERPVLLGAMRVFDHGNTTETPYAMLEVKFKEL